MSSVINTNTKALVAQNAMTVNNRSLSKAMEQLSTGKRINSAADDAAGLAISSRMTSQIRGLNQAVRNANDAVSMLQTTEGALNEVTNMLQRMRELSVQAATTTNGQSERDYLDSEYQQLKTEIGRITSSTKWNGMAVLDGSNSSQTFHVGYGTSSAEKINVTLTALSATTAGATTAATGTTTYADSTNAQVSRLTIGGTATIGNTIEVNVNGTKFAYTVDSTDKPTVASRLATALSSSGLYSGYTFATDSTTAEQINITGTSATAPFSLSTTVTGGLSVLSQASLTDIKTASKANTNIDNIDLSLTKVSEERAKYGSVINRLNYTVDNLSNVVVNASASRSRIEDADYASTTSELARSQIIQQAATAMLAQANQQPQTVLSLLK